MAPQWDALYRQQDWTLGVLAQVNQQFHLSGGTALSRAYYGHRYSEDLDFFVNDREEFGLWRDRCFNALVEAAEKSSRQLEVLLREERFGRAVLHGEVDLKLEFINDVPSRVGNPWRHAQLGLVDSKENILANKITALVDRAEPKDLADLYWLCCRDGLDLNLALEDARGKAAGVFPPLVAKRLEEAAAVGVAGVWWITAPSPADFQRGIEQMIGQLLTMGTAVD